MSLPTCRCGHDRHHKKVSAEAEHGVLGYARLIIGGTPIPKLVRFRCRDCGQVIEETDDPEVRRQHT
jgi:hypothetical protein